MIACSYSDFLGKGVHFGVVLGFEAQQEFDHYIAERRWIGIELVIETMTSSLDNEAKKTAGTHLT